MSTELKPTSAFYMTRFSGGQDRGTMVQITQIVPDEYMHPYRGGYVTLTVDQAREMGEALLEFAEGKRDEVD